jgi:hypothetical protein
MFGMGFWLNHGGDGAREVDVEKMLEIPWERQEWKGDCLCREAPHDMIAAIGSGYQRMFIVPSMRLVIVRQGVDNSRFSDAKFLRLIFSSALGLGEKAKGKRQKEEVSRYGDRTHRRTKNVTALSRTGTSNFEL